MGSSYKPIELVMRKVIVLFLTSLYRNNFKINFLHKVTKLLK